MLSDSPLLQDLFAERDRDTKQAAIVRFLQGRFGGVPEELAAWVRTIQDLPTLDHLIDVAASCPNLETFRQHLPA